MKIPFNIIYNEYYKPIYGFIYRLTFSKSDSEDIVQDVFIKLHAEITKGNEIDNAKAWLYRCSLNIFLNNKKRKKVIHFTDNIHQFEKESSNSLENDILIKEKKQKITEALLSLQDHEQAIINLYNDDLSYKQISEIMGIKFSSVGKTLSRAIEKLSNQIKLISHGEMCEQRNIV
jgi:RNA polymerase sigma-70 factor (ECF subfamily)